MITVTIAGRLGKDAELRQAGSSQVCSFSVAADTGFGDKKQSHWFDCSIWGRRGEAMAQYLKKGQEVVVIGEYSEREHNGKQYKSLQVHDVQMMGKPQAQTESQSYSKQPQQFNNNMSNQPVVDTPADDSIPF